VKSNSIHVAHWGVSVTTPQVSKDSAQISVTTLVENNDKNKNTVVLKLVLTNVDGKEIVTLETPFLVEPGNQTIVSKN